MYQSLIKRYPEHVEAKKIHLMRSHYLGRYTGVVTIESPIINQVMTAKRYKNDSSDYKWLWQEDAPETTVTAMSVSHTNTPYIQLFKRLNDPDTICRDQWYNVRIYFENFDKMTEFVDWAVDMEKRYKFSWIKSIQGADESAEYDQITVRSPKLAQYNFKVMLKWINLADKNEVRKLKKILKQFENQIRCSGELNRVMQGNEPYYGASQYFYCTDETSITYFSLAFSHWIKKIYRINHFKKESE